MMNTNKFEEFDAYLERYATENETSLNYWGNCACADASNLITIINVFIHMRYNIFILIKVVCSQNRFECHKC